MPTETFQIDSVRMERVKRAQKLQHVFGAVLLASAALDHLRDPASHHVVLPLLELVAAGALIAAAIADKIRRLRGGHHWKIGWVEIAGAVMMLVEAVAKLQEPHKLLYHVLTFVPPVILLFFGLFDLRITQSIGFRADDEHLLFRPRPIYWRRFAWKSLRALRVTPTHFELETDDGKTRRFKTAQMRNREAAMAWLEDQFARRRSAAEQLDGGEGGADQGDRDQPLVAGDR